VNGAGIRCKIWYLISRTVSDDDAHCGDIDDRSVRAFAVKPAPSARRDAALGLTARRGRANPATVPLMHSLRCSGNHGTRLSDNVRLVECWFSHLSRGLHRLDVAKVTLFDPHTAAVGGRARAEVRADG
jgi:hypothetical protein